MLFYLCSQASAKIPVNHLMYRLFQSQNPPFSTRLGDGVFRRRERIGMTGMGQKGAVPAHSQPIKLAIDRLSDSCLFVRQGFSDVADVR
ncbi:MAG TPA: hypothetical protein VNZ53_12285, partial [Steroidobacteraceae bacterium]|nr:hypothetical protein [Steroidobacteraceae bacterium]